MLDNDQRPHYPEQLAIAYVVRQVENGSFIGEEPEALMYLLKGISKMFGKLDLSKAEITLREVNSGLYLIAQPTNTYSDRVARLPHSGEHDYPYIAAVATIRGGVNLRGLQPTQEETYEKALALFDTNPAENLRRLSQAGFAYPKPGSVITFRGSEPRLRFIVSGE